MTSPCLPPPGTAAGTVHVLSAEGSTTKDEDRVPFKATWDGSLWWSKGCQGISVRKATMCGFRYVTEFIPVPKGPLLAEDPDRRPPFTVTLPGGRTRDIVEEVARE